MAATQKEAPTSRTSGRLRELLLHCAGLAYSNPPAGLAPEISPGDGRPLLVGPQVPHGTLMRDLGVAAHPGVFVDVAANPAGFVDVAAARGGFHMRVMRCGRLVIYRRGQKTDDRRWRPGSSWRWA